MSDKSNALQHICVLGSNGQVGLEVCLFLSDWSGVHVMPISRTLYGSALLHHLGLECRHGQLADEKQAADLLQNGTLVADFGWPSNAIGKLGEIRRRISNAIHHAPTEARYVFISTQSVYRLDPSKPRFSTYSLSKRYAERIALLEGKRMGRSVYVLRLGQVHGPLQRVSKAIISAFRPQAALVPSLRSYTVFTYSIAEALANIALGREEPGIYTVFSNPEWRWPEMHEYYAKWTGIPSTALEEPVPVSRHSLPSRIWHTLRTPFADEILRQKDLIEWCGSRLLPEYTAQLRLNHYRRRAASEISRLFAEQCWRPYGQMVEVDGRRLVSLSDTRPFILAKNRALFDRVRASAPPIRA